MDYKDYCFLVGELYISSQREKDELRGHLERLSNDLQQAQDRIKVLENDTESNQ